MPTLATEKHVIVRPFEPSDGATISRIHEVMNLGYAAPEWDEALVSAVIEAEEGIEAAAFLRQTAEVYLLVNPEMKLRKREIMGRLLLLHKELIPAAKRAGLDDVHCWPPPEMDQGFGRVLMRLGWTKALWPCYSREVK